MAISGCMYDAGKKLSHKRVSSGDKDQMDKTTDKTPKCKVALMKGKVTDQQKDQQPTQSNEVTKIWDTSLLCDTSKMDTNEELLYNDDDSLPDPSPLSQPKKFDS